MPSQARYTSMPVLESWYNAIDLGEVIASIPDKRMRAFYTKKLEKATEQSAHEKEYPS